MPEPITIVARRRYGKTDCVVKVTYIQDNEVQRRVEELAASFILHNLVTKRLDPAV